MAASTRTFHAGLIAVALLVPPARAQEPAPLATMTDRGGLCPYGPCRTEVVIGTDGGFVWTQGAVKRSGRIGDGELGRFKEEIKKADFKAMKSRRFSGTCPTAYDGPERTYTFTTPQGREEIAACTYQVDGSLPLFKSADDLFNRASMESEISVSPADIPNFREVAPGLYRGGQPSSAGWAFLKAKGVRTVVKLNFKTEGSDEEAARLGMTVIDASGPPSELGDMLGAPEPARIRLAVEALRDESLRPVYVHCLHGQDRTGLVVGLYRVLHERFSKEKAYAEMRAIGFHRTLRGLRGVWKRFDGKTLPGEEPKRR